METGALGVNRIPRCLCGRLQASLLRVSYARPVCAGSAPRTVTSAASVRCTAAVRLLEGQVQVPYGPCCCCAPDLADQAAGQDVP